MGVLEQETSGSMDSIDLAMKYHYANMTAGLLCGSLFWDLAECIQNKCVCVYVCVCVCVCGWVGVCMCV